jgi:fucose permease
MYIGLLVIIYLSFISLGLPDSLLGSAWPSMSADMAVPLSYAGILSMTIAGCTIISSFLSDRIIRRLGTGLVTALSVSLTAFALLGVALSPGFWWLCVIAVPLGLGAGSVDTALNNFVALHYKARHMNWLHCFWGVGATLGPVIMSLFLKNANGWKMGYGTIGVVQAVLVAALFLSLPLWKKAAAEHSSSASEIHQPRMPLREVLKISGVKSALLAFFFYCALETTTGLWGSSYMVSVKGLSAEEAARWISMFYLGITAGRLICGFLSIKLDNKKMIRIGEIVMGAGLAFVFLPAGGWFLQFGFMMLGLGCAPVFPGMLHETPVRFGKGISQTMVGLQMGFAYIGSTFMPALFGAISQNADISLFPYYLLAALALMVFTAENVSRIMRRKAHEAASAGVGQPGIQGAQPENKP